MAEKNEKIDFRSPAKLRAEKRRKEIVALYLDLKARAVAGSAEYRIMDAVAQRFGCTQQNVRAGVYKVGQRA